MAARTPGFIVYTDKWSSALLSDFTNAELGQLFRAMVAYHESGEVTEFKNRALKHQFIEACRMIDTNNDQYEETDAQRKYARYCRQQMERELTAVDFVSWKNTNGYGTH